MWEKINTVKIYPYSLLKGKNKRHIILTQNRIQRKINKQMKITNHLRVRATKQAQKKEEEEQI
jgi:hypothetical protein